MTRPSLDPLATCAIVALMMLLPLSAFAGGPLATATPTPGIPPTPPPNDECAAAIPVGYGTFSGSSAAAGADGDSACGCGGAADVWFAFTAPATEEVRIDLCGTFAAYGTDMVMSVHSGCPGTTMNEIDCNDDSPFAGCSGLKAAAGDRSRKQGGGEGGAGGLDPAVEISAVSGLVYYIRIARLCGGTSPFILNITPVPPDPTPSPSPFATASPTASVTPTPSPSPTPNCAGLTLVTTLANPLPFSFDEFGGAVALSGNLALVGARLDDTTGHDAGSAYVFDATTGALLHTLANPEPLAADAFGGDQFGLSVALEGDLALIGAPEDDLNGINTGTAYLFNASTGALVRTIGSPGPNNNEAFGYSVALSGNRALIGAPDANIGGTPVAGRAQIIDVNTGALLLTIQEPPPVTFARFGWAVALQGDRALIGAPSDPTAGSEAGAAHLFDSLTGTLIHTYLNPTGPFLSNDFFGGKVALDGSVNLVAAAANDLPGLANVGTALQYNGISGSLVRTIENPEPGDSEAFGTSVSVEGTRALIGVNVDSASASLSGAAHLIDLTTGANLAKIENPAALPSDDWFGTAVSLRQGRALIGAPYAEGFVGAAYVFAPDAICPTVTPTPPPTPSPTAAVSATASPTPALPSPTATAPPCCPGDANNSGSFVDANDFIAVQANFGADNGVGGPGDANCSGSFVDANDFIAVQANFGSDCG